MWSGIPSFDFVTASSTNCLNGGRICQYAEAQFPLRERRKRELRALLPGEQEPWAPRTSRSDTSSPGAGLVVSRPLAGTAFDPFGTLPVNIPVSVRELFHSCK